MILTKSPSLFWENYQIADCRNKQLFKLGAGCITELRRRPAWAEADIWAQTSWSCTRPLRWSWPERQGHTQRWTPGSGSGSGLQERECRSVGEPQTQQPRCQPLRFLPGSSPLSADLRKRRGPWEIKCLALWDTASLLLRQEFLFVVELRHPREHLVLGSPALHIITSQLMYTCEEAQTPVKTPLLKLFLRRHWCLQTADFEWIKPISNPQMWTIWKIVLQKSYNIG